MLQLNMSSEPEIIRMDQMPTKLCWSLIPLYKSLPNGSSLECHISYMGQLHLDITITDETAVVIRETITISNPADALREARHQYKIKYRAGYYPVGDKQSIEKIMKGYTYGSRSIKSWPVYVQPTIKGIKVLSYVDSARVCQDNGIVSIRSPTNRFYTHMAHLTSCLQEYFLYLPRYSILEGDLYIPGSDSATLDTAVKNPEKSNAEIISKIEYWISDIIYNDSEGTPFEKRHSLLLNSYTHFVQDNDKCHSLFIIPVQLCYTPDDLSRAYAQYLQENYNGMYIKKISNNAPCETKQYEESLYKQGNCNHILKYTTNAEQNPKSKSIERSNKKSEGKSYPT